MTKIEALREALSFQFVENYCDVCKTGSVRGLHPKEIEEILRLCKEHGLKFVEGDTDSIFKCTEYWR